MRLWRLGLVAVLFAGAYVSAGLPAARTDDFSEAFVKAAERIRPSVVAIRVTKKVTVGSGWRGSRRFAIPDLPEEFRPYLEQRGWALPPRDEDEQADRRPRPRPEDLMPIHAVGSGVVYSEDGHVITNHHVIQDADSVQVTFLDGETVDARVLAGDPNTDLAVIKVDTDRKLTPAHFADSKELRVGQWVLAVGSPFGLTQSVSAGIVSGLGRNVGAIHSQFAYEDFIQTDADINNGSSGGPLVDLDGEVVGICIAITSELNLGFTPYPGTGFAIPANQVKAVARELLQRGKVVRGYLGVALQVLPPDQARQRGLERPWAVVVRDVLPGSPAARAGFRPGDVILKYDDEEVTDLQRFRALVAATTPGTEVEVEVLRDDEEESLEVTIGEQPDQTLTAREVVPSALGMQLQTLTEDLAEQMGYEGLAGALVTEVEPDSPADQAGLEREDLILEVDKKPVDSARTCLEALRKAGHKVLIRMKKHSGEALYVTIVKE